MFTDYQEVVIGKRPRYLTELFIRAQTPEAKLVMALSDRKHWFACVLPFKGMPEGSIIRGSNRYVPLEFDNCSLPREAVNRKEAVESLGLRIAGWIVRHELDENEKSEQHIEDYLLDLWSTHRRRIVLGAVGLVVLGVVTSAVATVVLASTGAGAATTTAAAAGTSVATGATSATLAAATFVPLLALDPGLICVLDDGEYTNIEICNWV